MAKIEVDRQTILSAAKAVEKYCELQKTKMRDMDRSVKSVVTAGWSGADATAFLQQWEGVDSDSSTAVRLQKALENYAKSLRACEETYRAAQRDIYNQARISLW